MEQQKNSGKSWRLVLWAIVAVLLGVGALAAWKLRDPSDHPPGQVPMLPIRAEAIRKDLQALVNLDPGGLVQLLEPDAALRAFAEHATAGKSSSEARAEAIVAALAERRAQRGFVEWSRVEPRIGAPLSAAETLRAIQQNGAERQLYPLELAALGVAALRSVEVPAMLAEVYAFPNEQRPVDPSGRFGYFAIFLGEVGRGRVYDAYAGRSEQPAAADIAVLNDAQAVGAALGLRALSSLRNDLDVDAADRDSSAALKLLPSSPSAHATRAAVMLTVGHPAHKEGQAGKQELLEAQKLRDGAAQRNNLALYALTRQDTPGAIKELGDVLSKTPEYALAHVTRATALLIQHDFTGARGELELAAKYDPELALIAQMKAQLLASEGKSDEALVEARRAVALSPADAGSLFILARIEHRLGLKDDARKHALQILERTPAAAREERKLQVKAMLGSDVLDAAPKSAAAGSGG
jgi:Tfp pilus assembly protein PilF